MDHGADFNVFLVSCWGEGTGSRKELCMLLTLYPASPVWCTSAFHATEQLLATEPHS